VGRVQGEWNKTGEEKKTGQEYGQQAYVGAVCDQQKSPRGGFQKGDKGSNCPDAGKELR